VFLRYPGLIPFAALGDTEDPEETLRQVAQKVEEIPYPEAQANISTASAILAGLRLDDDTIFRLLRRDIMQESTVYQSILAEGQARGEVRGVAIGEARGLAIGEARGDARRQRVTVLKLLRRGLALDVIAEDMEMSLEEVRKIQLSKAL
jgi:predicted transposase YdaD